MTGWVPSLLSIAISLASIGVSLRTRIRLRRNLGRVQPLDKEVD